MEVALRELLNWLGRVLKKWWIWLGLFPLLLDFVSAYIPADDIPSQLSSLLEVGANWQVTLVLVAIGMLVSAFLVHLETNARLAAYEYQAPEYELKPKEIRGKFCRSGCHVEVVCHYTIRTTNAFRGHLVDVAISEASQVRGLDRWEVNDVGHGPHNTVKLPLHVPYSERDLKIVTQAKIQESAEVGMKKDWENVHFLLQLVAEYFTQPMGDTRKLFPVEVHVDFGELLDTHVSSKKAKGS